MCLIVHKPAHRALCADFLREAWRRNPDGWGCFYLRDGVPVHDKGMDLDGLLALYAALPLEQEVYIHLRQATFGPVTHDMAHPFVVREGLLLMHNGSIGALAPSDGRRSDTAELARLLGDLLQDMDAVQSARFIRSEALARLLSPLIGQSRLVLLDAEGAVRLGKAWHTVAQPEWSAQMHGIEVSNIHAWQPRCRRTLAQWWQTVQVRWRWLQPVAAVLRVS